MTTGQWQFQNQIYMGKCLIPQGKNILLNCHTMFIIRQQVNYTGNVTAAEYTSSLDIFYVMCYK